MKQEFSKILSVYSSHFKPVRSYTAAVGLLFAINKATTTTTTAGSPGSPPPSPRSLGKNGEGGQKEGEGKMVAPTGVIIVIASLSAATPTLLKMHHATITDTLVFAHTDRPRLIHVRQDR